MLVQRSRMTRKYGFHISEQTNSMLSDKGLPMRERELNIIPVWSEEILRIKLNEKRMYLGPSKSNGRMGLSEVNG